MDVKNSVVLERNACVRGRINMQNGSFKLSDLTSDDKLHLRAQILSE